MIFCTIRVDFLSIPYSRFQCYRGYEIYEKYMMHGSVKWVSFACLPSYFLVSISYFSIPTDLVTLLTCYCRLESVKML